MKSISLFRCLAPGIVLILAGGCASLNWPESEPPQQRKAPAPSRQSTPSPTTGIATGESAAAMRRDALSGRAINAGELGYFMDVHEARLRQVLANSPIELRRGDNRLVLIIPGGAGFATGSTVLGSDVAQPLTAVATVMSEFKRTLVIINGHTDNSGTSAFNQQLSQQRALAVARFFQEQGVETERLIAIGHGENQPVADNATSEGRAENRRTEIVIEPITAGQENAVSSPLIEG